MSTSPQRNRGGGGGGNKEERPRFFDSKAKSKCWAKAEILAGRHPERWRKDAAGNVVCKRFCNCQGCLCFEYDHIVPYSKGPVSPLSLSPINCRVAPFVPFGHL
ncbi:HNH endonuclease domain-containing protein [Actinidia rufa]|uniref:HNH endonuclease domain-containing protein n=1 Tax=Actinidia rufa TaxID=165716 RepID=A0A7J0GMT8_9ERIC|nr:HNH endonuclease domain-containing protein [Actinidia rufa]